MLTRRLFAGCALCAATAGLIATRADAQTPIASPASGLKRTILQQTDGPAEGFVTILAQAEIAPGTIIMRHTHPGIESTYVLAGGGVLSVQGQPDRTIAPGDGFEIPTAVPHALHNGDATTRLAATYVVEKGKPLASLAPA